MERGRHLITELAATTNISYKKALCIRIRPFNLRHTSPPQGASCPGFSVKVPVDGSSPVLQHTFVIPTTDDQAGYFFNRASNPDLGRCGGVSYQAYYVMSCNNGAWSAPNIRVSCNY
jgi:hypothetical protein